MVLSVFLELGTILVIATVLAGIMKFLRQPLLIGYILTGILVSPHFLNLVESDKTIALFSHIGVSLLLFIVGLGLDLNTFKTVGKVSIITGVGQVLFTSIFGAIISLLLGFSPIESIYIAVALTFSSTIIIMKLLSDKGDLDSLYGRISMGFLIVQDLIVVGVLLLITSVSNGATILEGIITSTISTVSLAFAIYLFNKFVLKKILTNIAKSQEFLLLFAISWCFFISSLFNSFHLSLEIGALIAGISLASSEYKFEIISKLKPVRDFFLVLFFIFLGSQMVFSDVNTYIIPIIIFSLFILIGNPLIVLVLMGMLGYTKKTGFQAGLTVAQISEFSLILIGLGVSVGHLTSEILSMVTIVGIITITGSTYLIMYSNKIYPHLAKMLTIFEKKHKRLHESLINERNKYEVVLFGYNRIGTEILESFDLLKKEVLIIDFDPEVIHKMIKKGYNCRFGDATDVDMISEIAHSNVKMFISTIPNSDVNFLLLSLLKSFHNKSIFIVVSHEINKAVELYEKGASYVLLPHHIGAQHISTMIENYSYDHTLFAKERKKHLDYLKKKKKI